MFWARSCIFIEGGPKFELGSLRDRIRNTVWYRREQRSIFETLINLYAAVIAINPDVAKKVATAIDEYIDLIVPGSKKYRKEAEATAIENNAKALDAIYDAISKHQQSLGR